MNSNRDLHISPSLSTLFGEERPITVDEACEIRMLLFGSTTKTFSDAWNKQGFKFRPFPSYGFLQKYAGPCGIMSAVQAFVIYELLFGYSRAILDKGQLRPSVPERREALARALTSILWQAGQNISAIVAKKSLNAVLDESNKILEGDGILEKLKLLYFQTKENLLSHMFNFLQVFMNPEGCVLFLYSVILTHGFDKIKEEIGISGEPFIEDKDYYCSIELVNLIIIGKAVGHCHNNDKQLPSEGEEPPVLLRGIPERSKIGLLTTADHHGLYEVGSNYKDPEYPIWVLQGCQESHFTTLFSTNREIFRQPFERFEMVYFDCSYKPNQETLLTINPAGEVPEDDENDNAENLPVYICCIKSRWPQAMIKPKIISKEEE